MPSPTQKTLNLTFVGSSAPVVTQSGLFGADYSVIELYNMTTSQPAMALKLGTTDCTTGDRYLGPGERALFTLPTPIDRFSVASSSSTTGTTWTVQATGWT